MSRLIRFGPVVLAWYGRCQKHWGIYKWFYNEQSSWRHGTLYIGPVKVMW